MGLCRFDSRSVHEAQAVVSRCFESRVRAFEPQGELDFRFIHLDLSETTSLSRIRYGTAVVLDTENADQTLMVAMCLSGSNLLQMGNDELRMTADNHLIFVPGEMQQRREADCDMLILRIHSQRIRTYATAHLGFVPRSALVFRQRLHQAPHAGRRLRHLGSLILAEGPDALRVQCVREHYEQLLIATLLFEHPNSYRELFDAQRGVAAPACVRRAEEYIRAHAGSVITLESLARASNSNIRTLQLAFKKFRGCTPMQKVKSIRLGLVRRELLESRMDASTVTEIATKWGFTHLGSFSQDYRARYGETPSSTRRHSA